ncbi:hypothetical protein SAMN06265379_104275 [Saccharicrinis carchari]|uniref:Uncharacterized protein n=1 Tax=Saccharicrinis carchari TaxID=1168039 RepID=A0A521D5S2_SACCC|nr:hypothetical protein [Saccharicrinis carchari]SMO67038.1 hypothetical protein SAMN06265379_104275 [Saccharicrinis carchari]
MKNIFKLLFAFSVLLVTSCDNDPDLRMPDTTDGFLPRIDINAVAGSSLVDASNIDDVVFAMDLGIEDGFTKTTASRYDLIVKYGKLDKSYVTAVVEADVKLGAVSYTIDEVVAALGVNKANIAVGESMVFALDVTLASGKKLPAFVNGNSTYSSSVLSLPNVSPIANYAVACGIFADFTGNYKVEYVSGAQGTVFGYGIFEEGEIVEMKSTGYTSRQFGFSYLFGDFGLVDLKLELSCGDILVQHSKSGIGCGGPGLNLGPTNTIYSYDPNDDSELMISFTENIDAGCGGSPQEVVLRLVKQ